MAHSSRQHLPTHYFVHDLSPTHTSPPTSASTLSSWPPHRTSNTRDLFPPLKHESSMNDRVNGISQRSPDDPMPSTSDFVKKLYKMLEDPSFQSVVSWGPQGDCFVVKDMNEFTKSILPRMFKHSNFASFVRQLNKYDFHKVKNTDDNQFGEHSWTFRHPDFHADRRDALENIKRKVPAARKNQQPASTLPLSSHPYPSSSRGRSVSPPSLASHISVLHGNPYPSVPVLQSEIQRLREEGDDLRGRIRNLERNYESVLVEMVAFQRGMAQQDGLMQNMISYFLTNQSAKGKTPQRADDAEAQGFFPPMDASPSSSAPRNPLSNSAVQELQTQLRQQQTQHERVQTALQTQLNQATRERKRHETVDRPTSPVSQPPQGPPPQPQFISQPPPSADSTSRTPHETPQYGGSLDHHGLPDTNPFLPPHAVQRIIGSGTPARSFTPNGSELGKASLLQMNELSRRAAYLNANGEDGNLWSGMNFTTDGPSSGQQPERRLPVQGGIKPTHGLGQPRDGQRETTGWEDPDASPSVGGGADGAKFATGRTMSEERGRVGFDVSMARDDSSIGLRIGVPEALEERKGGTRGRQSESNFLARDDAGIDRSDGYTVASQQAQQQTALSSGTRASTKPQTTVPDPWASLIAGQPVLGMLDSGFNASSSCSGSIEEDLTHEGLQVYTVGHLLPKGMGIGGGEDPQGWWALDSDQSGAIFGDATGAGSSAQGQQPEGYNQDSTQFSTSTSEGDIEEEVVQPSPANYVGPGTAASLSSSSSGSGSRKLRVRRSTYVPGWAVPPRVLLVDDDAVSRKLSSKFLKVFGCTIDVAVDGVGAVNKMNLEKYDLVLMDIVMPKLDGVSATNLIRKFDQGTPIISMTSNSKPNEIMTYYSSGMNDILPKPFTKEGLLEMLEKHLMHLKVIQQMSKLPRSISTSMFEQGYANSSILPSMQAGNLPPMIESSSAIGSGATSNQSGNEPTGVTTGRSTLGILNFGGTYNGGINLLAGMGLTDDQYARILQNMVNGDGLLSMMDDGMNVAGNTEKRSLDDLSEDGRNRKRSRFETIE